MFPPRKASRLPVWSPSTHPWILPIQAASQAGLCHLNSQILSNLPILPLNLTPATFLQADTQSSTLLIIHTFQMPIHILQWQYPNEVSVQSINTTSICLTTSATLCIPLCIGKTVQIHTALSVLQGHHTPHPPIHVVLLYINNWTLGPCWIAVYSLLDLV